MTSAQILMDEKLNDVQILLDKALLNPEWALRFIQDARIELFNARQIVRNEMTEGYDNE